MSPADGTWTGAPPPPTHTFDAGQLRGLRALSLAAMGLLAVVTVLHLVSIPNDLAYIDNVEHVVDNGFADQGVLDEIEDQEDLRGTFAALSLAALLASAVTWILWQQRARACAKGLGAGGQRHSEPLAAFSWIIPIGNLWLPKQVTDDLWRASDPDAPVPTNVEGKPVWGLINVWWALWIVGGIIGRFLFSAEEPATVAELDSYASKLRIELGATVLTLAAAVLAFVIVQRITLRLATRAERAGVTG